MLKCAIKQILSPKQVRRLKQLKATLQQKLFAFLARSKRLSSLYWGLFPASFAGEHYGIMYGISKYADESNRSQETQYLLRRNIHRLEKGLLMRPRRDIFALDYIEETVGRYAQIVANTCSETVATEELQWAHDVLTQYFAIGVTHPVIDKARVQFQNLPVKTLSDEACVPYKRNLNAPVPVSYIKLLELSRQRRSVRWYLQQPVPRDAIDKAIVVAALSPSACNRQPFEFRVFDDPALVQQIVALPGGTTGFGDNIPVIVVLVGKLRAYAIPEDRHLIYIDAAFAAMSFMYALETLGLGSCAINWHDRGAREKKMARLLHLEPDERIVMLISVGCPDPEGMIAFSQKKTLDVLRRYN